MTQLDYQSMPGALPFNSQRGGLIGFGVVFIVIGLFLLLGALSLPLALLVSPQSVDWGALLPIEVVYVVGAGIFIFIGIESIRARRWVRPVGIVCGALGVIGGVIALLAMILQWSELSRMGAMTNPNSPGTPIVMQIGMIIGMAMIVIFYIALPALIFWFYRRSSVRTTVMYFDPTPSWTDDKPLCLVAAVVIELIVALSIPVMLMYGVFPLFSVLVKGLTAATLYLSLIGAHLFAAWLLFKRKEAGIWLALLLPISQMASTSVAIAHHGFATIFAQPRIIQGPNVYQPPPPDFLVIVVVWGLMLLGWFAFLMYTRRRLHLIVSPSTGEAVPS